MELINETQFQEKVLNSDKLVLVDFFATWCGPCHMVAPILDQISKESDGSYEIYKVDVDENESLARKYGIMSIPTMILFKDGKQVDKVMGFRPKNQIVEVLNTNLK
ncbi:MAG: thioredoxin [Christensenellales bacterium]